MGREIIDYINSISDFKLSSKGVEHIDGLINRYGEKKIRTAMKISKKQYLRTNENGSITRESILTFINKIGGIAYNLSLNPIDKEIQHVKSIIINKTNRFNELKFNELIDDFHNAIKAVRMNDNEAVKYIRNVFIPIANKYKSYARIHKNISYYINSLWEKSELLEKRYETFLIPTMLIKSMDNYSQHLSLQINVAYNNNLYDCCALCMNKLVESYAIRIIRCTYGLNYLAYNFGELIEDLSNIKVVDKQIIKKVKKIYGIVNPMVNSYEQCINASRINELKSDLRIVLEQFILIIKEL